MATNTAGRPPSDPRPSGSESWTVERLRLAAAATGVGTFEGDLLTGALDWSDRCRTIFGVRPDTPVDGALFDALVHPDDRPRMDVFSEAMRRPQEDGDFDIEFRIVRPDGETRWIESRGRVVYGEVDGVPRAVRFLGAVVDVTERRRAAAELADALAAKEALLAEVNHRVKNSLQLVTSLCTLQASHADDERVARTLREASARIGVIAAVHERLYASQRHDRVDLGELLGALTRDTVGALSEAGRVGLVLTTPDTPIAVSIDRAVPIALVVNELVTNALKYAFPPPAAGVLRVGIEAAQAQGGLVVTVADDGVGLPDAYDPSASSGIGMRIVVALTRQLGGTLTWGHAAPGAIFALALPAG